MRAARVLTTLDTLDNPQLPVSPPYNLQMSVSAGDILELELPGPSLLRHLMSRISNAISRLFGVDMPQHAMSRVDTPEPEMSRVDTPRHRMSRADTLQLEMFRADNARHLMSGLDILGSGVFPVDMADSRLSALDIPPSVLSGPYILDPGLSSPGSGCQELT